MLFAEKGMDFPVQTPEGLRPSKRVPGITGVPALCGTGSRAAQEIGPPTAVACARVVNFESHSSEAWLWSPGSRDMSF